MLKALPVLAVLGLIVCNLPGADAPAAKPAAPAAPKTDAPAKPAIEPTFANVAYGTHERQVLDF